MFLTWRHTRWLALIVLLTFTFLGGMVAQGWRPWLREYRANAVIRVLRVVDPFLYESEKSGALPCYESYVKTQVAIIRCPAVLERVLDRSRVQDTQWYESLQGLGEDQAEMAIEELANKLIVSHRPDTELIDLSVVDRDPHSAMEIANAVADEFLKLSAEVQAASDHQLIKRLVGLSSQLEAEIRMLMEKTKAVYPQSIPTSEELLSQFGTQLIALETERDKLLRETKLIEWQLAASGAASSRPANTTSQSALEQRAAQNDFEIGLITEEIERLRAKISQSARVAHETAQMNNECQPKLELLDTIHKRIERLHIEREAPPRVQLASRATVPSEPYRGD